MNCPKCGAESGPRGGTFGTDSWHYYDERDRTVCLRRQLAQRTVERDNAEAACRAMIVWAEHPIESLPPGHTCGPEGNCDMLCVDNANYAKDLVAARKVVAAADARKEKS